MTNTPKRSDNSLLSMIEPTKFSQATKDPHLRKSMEEEMYQTEMNETWELVPHPKDKILLEPTVLKKNE